MLRTGKFVEVGFIEANIADYVYPFYAVIDIGKFISDPKYRESGKHVISEKKLTELLLDEYSKTHPGKQYIIVEIKHLNATEAVFPDE